MKKPAVIVVAVVAVVCCLALPARGQLGAEIPASAGILGVAENLGGDEKAQLYNGTDPNRNLQEYMPEPFSVARFPKQLDPELRAVTVTPQSIQLVRGGQLARQIAFDATGPVGLEEIAAAVSDSEWIAVPGPGIFELSAALVQDPGTELRIATPAVREVRLITNPGVFIGGQSARARFEGVTLTSWDRTLGAPSVDIKHPRPFVLYEKGSRLDIVDSDVGFLGSDRTSAYGVSWRVGGTTGEVLRSRFHHCFFGIYTYEAKDMVFRHNVFSDNTYYGFDPHDYSTGLVVEDNEAYGNGSHGFIVSRYVTGSTLARNYSHDNGGNGIVVDYRSDGNRIVANRVERNAKDGIVLNGSSGNVVEGNQVASNRVGIRASHENKDNRIVGNRLDGNVVGVALDAGTTAAELIDNEILGSTRVGMLLDAPGSSVAGGEVTDADIGVDIRASVTITGLRVSGVEDGVVMRANAEGVLRDVVVNAIHTGVRSESGSRSSLGHSVVRAARPVAGALLDETGSTYHVTKRGTLPWQPAAVGTILLTAVTLEFLRTRRDPTTRPEVPSAVWNTT